MDRQLTLILSLTGLCLVSSVSAYHWELFNGTYPDDALADHHDGLTLYYCRNAPNVASCNLLLIFTSHATSPMILGCHLYWYSPSWHWSMPKHLCRSWWQPDTLWQWRLWGEVLIAILYVHSYMLSQVLVVDGQEQVHFGTSVNNMPPRGAVPCQDETVASCYLGHAVYDGGPGLCPNRIGKGDMSTQIVYYPVSSAPRDCSIVLWLQILLWLMIQLT